MSDFDKFIKYLTITLSLPSIRIMYHQSLREIYLTSIVAISIGFISYMFISYNLDIFSKSYDDKKIDWIPVNVCIFIYHLL